MSSVFKMLGLETDDTFQIVFLLPVLMVLVAFTLLLKLSVRKPEESKKSQSFKKQSKVTTIKQKEDKLSSEKKEKGNKEKKTSSSPAKKLEKTNVDTTNSKKNKKQEIPIEKSPKKNVQSKKQQVNNHVINNANNKLTLNQTNNKKQLQNFLSREEEGEWQMVTTKKQKQNKLDEATIEINVPSHTNKKPEKTNKTVKNKVKVTSEKSDYSTAVNDEITSTEIGKINKTELQTNELPIFSTNVPIPSEHLVPEIGVDNSITSSSKCDVKIVNASTVNVAFDELGDEGWTDTKPQKKSRRKALRE